jgi:alcohol dehydrogenase
MPQVAGTRIVLNPTPPAHFGAGAVDTVAGVVTGTGGQAAVVVTDQGLAATPVVASVVGVLTASGIPVTVFSGVHANPTTGDVAAGAEAVAALAAGGGRPAVVAVGGGSSVDAAKGIAVAAVNPERGRDLDYRRTFSAPALPLVAVPTTAGTGTETNAFGVITDPVTRRKFYVGSATARPAAAILDPELTASLPPGATAATGMDALVHALESCMSRRANPWSEGIALQAIRMISAYLPRAVADGADMEARSQMLLASHLAGIAFASTGLGICHAIGHALGGRFDIAHGVALTMVLPGVLRFNLPACGERLAAVAFALGAGDTARDAGWNADAAIDAVAALADTIGMTHQLPDFGITAADFDGIAGDALDDEVLANTPRWPTGADIRAILTGALDGTGQVPAAPRPPGPPDWDRAGDDESLGPVIRQVVKSEWRRRPDD